MGRMGDEDVPGHLEMFSYSRALNGGLTTVSSMHVRRPQHDRPGAWCAEAHPTDRPPTPRSPSSRTGGRGRRSIRAPSKPLNPLPPAREAGDATTRPCASKPLSAQPARPRSPAPVGSGGGAFGRRVLSGRASRRRLGVRPRRTRPMGRRGLRAEVPEAEPALDRTPRPRTRTPPKRLEPG